MARKEVVKERLRQIVSVTTQIAISRRMSRFKLQLSDRQEARRRRGGGVLVIVHGRSRMTIGPRIPTNTWTEHVGFSPTRQALLEPSANRRELLGGSHEG